MITLTLVRAGERSGGSAITSYQLERWYNANRQWDPNEANVPAVRDQG